MWHPSVQLPSQQLRYLFLWKRKIIFKGALEGHMQVLSLVLFGIPRLQFDTTRIIAAELALLSVIREREDPNFVI